MKTQRTPQILRRIVEFFGDIGGLASMITFSPDLVPVPVAARGKSAASAIRQKSWSRPVGRLLLLVGCLLLAAVPGWAGQPVLPTGAPNIFDPTVRAQFKPVGVKNLRDNPDFPVIILVNTADEQPQALLVGLDARNGKDTWSLTEDPIIFVVVFSDPTTIEGVYVDTGFADLGKPSGNYAAVDEMNSSALPDLLKAVGTPPKQTYM